MADQNVAQLTLVVGILNSGASIWPYIPIGHTKNLVRNRKQSCRRVTRGGGVRNGSSSFALVPLSGNFVRREGR
ncbi:hypothetical protein, partial [Vannielia sp.]|uniref:hypothetical protein n=1 Tax=Vannielia sp. TaxID=2813045 RepID=UPI00260BDA89